jgi:hypothetical protein
MARCTGTSKFQNMGIQFQMDSDSPQEARKAFKVSCNICVTRGLNVECKVCPIKAYHEQTIAVFADLEEYDIRKMHELSSTISDGKPDGTRIQ